LFTIALKVPNFLYRLAQLCQSGVHFRIHQQYITSPQPDTQPSSVSVSLVTVTYNLVLLARVWTDYLFKEHLHSVTVQLYFSTSTVTVRCSGEEAAVTTDCDTTGTVFCRSDTKWTAT